MFSYEIYFTLLHLTVWSIINIHIAEQLAEEASAYQTTDSSDNVELTTALPTLG